MRNRNLFTLFVMLFLILILGIGMLSGRELDICPGQTIEFEVEYSIAQDFTDNIDYLEQNVASFWFLECYLSVTDYTYSYPDFNITMTVWLSSDVAVGSIFTGDIDIAIYTNDDQCFGLPTEPITVNVVTAIIEVTAPTAGAQWPAGSSRFIGWDGYNDDNVKIDLYSGSNYHSLIVNSPSPAQHPYNWSIPADIELGNYYKVKITSLDNNAIYDFSPNFSITAAELSPPQNLSAELQQGDVVLTWDSYSQQSDCDGFKIYRNSDVIATVNSSSATTYTDATPPVGLMVYYITAYEGQEQSDPSNNAAIMVTEIEDMQKITQAKPFNLHAAPNPFNPNTTINFDLNSDSNCSLSIYNHKGQLVKQLIINQNMAVGSHTVAWDGKNSTGLEVSSGIYFCILKSNEASQTQKLHLIK